MSALWGAVLTLFEGLGGQHKMRKRSLVISIVAVVVVAAGLGVWALVQNSLATIDEPTATIYATSRPIATVKPTETTVSPTLLPTAVPPAAGHIYFSRDRAIWKFDVSSGQETLLADRYIIQDMSVSPDGGWLSYHVFEKIEPQSPRSIWVVDTHTGEEKKASSTVRAVARVWLPDSRLMVIEWPEWYISDDGDTLSKGPADYAVFNPVTGQNAPVPWYVPSPDDVAILYAPTFDCAAERPYPHAGTKILRVFCVDENEPTTVAKLNSLVDIDWSADGKALAFQSEGAIYIWQRGADELWEIDLNRWFATALSWSPDGQWLAFQDGQDQCVLNLQDEAVTCFEGYLSGGGTPLAVSWSPDSQKIVFATCAPAVCEQTGCDCSAPSLVTLSILDGDIVELTANVEFDVAPVWGK